ncbi:unnamed protein product, partial [Brenthis ino]
MPPKKVPRISGEPKTLRSRTKKRSLDDKNNPKLKVTIPLQNVPDSVKIPARDVMPMLGKNDIKIMLANEVVRRQFPKKRLLVEEPTETTNTKKVKINKTVAKKKPVLNRKRLLRKDKVSNEILGESLQGKNKRRAVAKKNTIIIESVQCNGSPDPLLAKTEEIPQESDKEESKNPIPVKGKRTLKKTLSGANKSVKENSQVITLNTISKRKLPLNRKSAVGPGPKTRKKAADVTTEKGVVPEEPKVDTKVGTEKDSLNTRRCSIVSSEFSWTKDISSSSTSTCVTVSSKDFFRIDNKIPVIKLTNIDRHMKSDDNSICVSVIGDTENNAKSDLENNAEKHVVDDGVHETAFPLNMSSSSSESSSDEEEEPQNNQNTSKVTSTLEKLASKLKNFDLEIINWIGYTDKNANSDITKFQDKLFSENFLYEERDVILRCQSITKILSDHRPDIDESEKENCERQHETNVNLDHYIKNKSDKSTDTEENLSDQERKPDQLEDKSVHNNTYNNDEDDALSLYAESITDMESPRNWCQKPREHNTEEYVPLPVKDVFKKPETITYKPTKIKRPLLKDPENVNEVTVCEKSNADSTSMYRENNDSTSEENIVIYEDRNGDGEKTKSNLTHSDSILTCLYENRSEVEKSKSLTSKDSILMSTYEDRNDVEKRANSIHNDSIIMGSSLKPILGVHSFVFKGVCFFNLASSCKNIVCKFPHKYFDNEEIKNRLKKINDQEFQEEFILLRSSSALRRLYGMCFIEECVRRKLTKVLVEMTLEFITRANSISNQDNLLAIEVIETTLLYLNNIDLSICEDLLKYKVKSNVLLCDAFINTIAKSQNFSRFKTVFINLTDFIYNIGRTFDCDVASNVLERVCILPFDENLARALLKLIKNTDVTILSNSMMSSFERQLSFSNKELYEEFLIFKVENFTDLRVANCYNSPLNESERISNNSGLSDNDIRYSPDTTNLDSLNKIPIEPKFTRTIDLNKLKLFNDVSNSSSADSDAKFSTRNNIKMWPSNNKRQLLRNPNMRPPLRPAYKRRSDQQFHGSPSKYPRRNGPTFF